MPTDFPRDGTLDELLPLARVLPEAVAARCWLEDALMAAGGTVEPRLAALGATRASKPAPAKHNAPLKKIERAAAQLIAALGQLRRHPYAHESFWSFKAVEDHGAERLAPKASLSASASRASTSASP